MVPECVSVLCVWNHLYTSIHVYFRDVSLNYSHKSCFSIHTCLWPKKQPSKTNSRSVTEMLLLHIEWGCSRSETVTDLSTFSPQGERATEEYVWCHQRSQEDCRGRIKNGQAGPHHRWQCKSLMNLHPKGFDTDYTVVLATPIHS